MTRGTIGWQTTIGSPVTITGAGVHTAAPASLTLIPATADTGICFVRADLDVGDDAVIPARHRHTSMTELATVIGDPSVAAVSTIEHLMSALYGLGVDNCIVEIDGPEVPILDGSAAPFAEAIDGVGVTSLAAPRRYLKILKTVRVENGAQFGELSPSDRFTVDVEIAFDAAPIGRQRVVLDIDPASYRRNLAGARTFGFLRDVERLWAAGYAMGASLDNTIVLGDEGVMNDEGLRWSDEFVRHKALDAVGDLALCGLPLLGAYRSSRGGHRLNSQVLEALFADASAYRIVEAETVRRPIRIPVLAGGRGFRVAPAYTPDR